MHYIAYLYLDRDLETVALGIQGCAATVGSSTMPGHRDADGHDHDTKEVMFRKQNSDRWWARWLGLVQPRARGARRYSQSRLGPRPGPSP